MTRRPYTPRGYFPLALDFLSSIKRKNLWAGMGLGKTSIVETYLDIAYNVWGDSDPTLVLAPLRVARSTWPEEAQKWEHLEGLEVVSVTGDEEERLAALKRPAHVYAMNYDNLVWLRDRIQPACHAAHHGQSRRRGSSRDLAADRRTVVGVVPAADDRDRGPLEEAQISQRKEQRRAVWDLAAGGGESRILGKEAVAPDQFEGTQDGIHPAPARLGNGRGGGTGDSRHGAQKLERRREGAVG